MVKDRERILSVFDKASLKGILRESLKLYSNRPIADPKGNPLANPTGNPKANPDRNLEGIPKADP